ncbi:mitochondrial import receptor subunit TOM22 homolog isoform X2 [Mya arenaria]|nr:mitochondrial import receptor subunit TOM22 homolog isoform X2 [Mya arenaria]XP_052768930.1 mitochondrial import receptor subunit TOM22 homolog isoform X2 [Mya arenaria]
MHDEDEEEFIDETLAERLSGLAEMFPEPVRRSCGSASQFTWSSVKVCFSYGRTAVWTLSSIFAIMFLPVLFERERASMQELQLQQQRQILLGPNAAMSGQNMMGGGMAPGPGMMPPPPGPQ